MEKQSFNSYQATNVFSFFLEFRYSFDDNDVTYIMEQDERVFRLKGTIEDVFPPLRHVYKSRNMKQLEELKNTTVEFIGKKYSDAKRCFNKGN